MFSRFLFISGRCMTCNSSRSPDHSSIIHLFCFLLFISWHLFQPSVFITFFMSLVECLSYSSGLHFFCRYIACFLWSKVWGDDLFRFLCFTVCCGSCCIALCSLVYSKRPVRCPLIILNQFLFCWSSFSDDPFMKVFRVCSRVHYRSIL